MRRNASCGLVALSPDLAKSLERVVECPLHGRHEELLLGAEEPEDIRLRDTDIAGDQVCRGAVQSGLAEPGDGRAEDLLATFLSRVSGCHCRVHAGKLVTTHKLVNPLAGSGFRSG